MSRVPEIAPEGSLDLNLPRRSRFLRWVLALVVVISVAAGIWAVHWCGKKTIEGSGGLYLPWRVEINVPQYLQSDPAWGVDSLGPTDSTLGREGCAVASAAMVLASYGVDTNPGTLNAFLKTNGGFTEQGWIYWEKAAELAPGKVVHVYEDKPSYALIDINLLKGNPVIVRLRYPSGVTHFVVVVGKQGFDYLIRDPGSGGRKGVYPLREFGSPIEALRFYRKLS